ncbi:uncharacterized protein LOC132459247 isoform X3 [Gadus macrocephalus]|uniref:uncharacterized protein LOC132459247 isoform X3 n=1 Tax=Gadus macrocephalus TaxID=80720 RepID=UPI0028CB71B4|nr:uncharacterized protein LOC132459247 isoform X3 [Gadus macrocephalus]
MVEAHTKGITMFLAFMLTICSVSVICGVASTASPSCPKDEYRVGIECCPACPAGKQVSKDCEERSMTKCKNCSDGTFQKGPNVKKQCSNCTKCDAGLGLKVKKSCSSTSDAVCEVLDGFFCSDSNGGGCRVVQRHTVCSPGQYIGQRGTADKDTECLPCANGTFSNGTSSCQPHTICDSVGGVQIQPGTDSTDSTCLKYVAIAFIIIGCICFIISLVLGALFYRWLKIERDLTEWEKQIDEMETPEQRSECYALWERLNKKKKTQKQKMKLDGGAAGEGTSGPSSTPLLSPELPAGLETSIPPAPSSETQPAGLETSIPPAPSSETQPAGLETSIPPAPSSETQPAGLETSIPPAPSSETQPAGLETSIPPAPSSETQPAGLETSIPPAPSSETQPAEETTPLMSSESPAPTGDQQEHTSRKSTPDVTMDGHDDDQSLDALAYRSGTGQLDIEMGPVQTLPKDRNRIL